MKEIPLTKGKIAQVSDHWFDYLNQWKWQARYEKSSDKWYATRHLVISSKKINTHIQMHRVIMNVPDGMEIDHKDGDGLNNQEDNLRICTGSQNSANKGISKVNKSGYKGVYWSTRERKWQAEIKVNQKTIYIGRYKDIKDGARAYNEAAKKYFGEFAWLNKVEK
jgi:hypothetical protein